MKNYLFTFLFMSGLFIILIFLLPMDQWQAKKKKESGAGLAMDAWAFARAYPASKIEMSAFTRGWQKQDFQRKLSESIRSDQAAWEAIGPKNIGGRTLCLAFNPLNPNTIYAGSASGGLWVSHSAGEGYSAWQQVETGFPVLGVSTIAIHPADTNIMYIGTGEVYNYQNTAPGVVNRLTRGTYGIGILKSTDGGQSWTKSLDWSYEDLRGINEIVLNPLRPETVYAATTEGLYRSYDGGANWTLIHPVQMAVDIEIHSSDTSRIFVASGNFGSAGNGIYRSVNSGASFSKLSGGLPNSVSGKIHISIYEANPNILYASVAETFFSAGLYQSADGGDTWTNVNAEDVAKYQGWYSHDIAVHPSNSNTLIYVGIDTWKSTDGGSSLTQKSYWSAWDFGLTPVGGPEGPPFYVHADIHAAYYHPANANHVFLATDGGIFFSADGGENFEGRNGSYQTQQFYANFSNSPTDSAYAVGGMQDNATAIYVGGDSWKRAIGGDGLSASIHPVHDDTIFGSYQYLGMARSYDKGDNFEFIVPPGGNANTSFAAPFELAPTMPDRIYAGREYLFRSDNLGDTWTQTTVSPIDGNPIKSIAVSHQNPDLVYLATAPFNSSSPPAGIFKSTNAGASWTNITAGLPNRIPMDLEVNPENDNILYVVYSGFGTSHVYKSENGGINWSATDSGLPDLPTNTIAIDPENTDHLYIGNDLGIYFSHNGGKNWEIFVSGLPDATLVMHLSISESNRKLRAATHGNGVYQSPLVPAEATGIAGIYEGFSLGQNYPNPVRNITRIPFSLDQPAMVSMTILDQQGKIVWNIPAKLYPGGEHEIRFEPGTLASGMYQYQLEGKTVGSGEYFDGGKTLLKL